MARYQILVWRDVPSVLKAFDDDGNPVSRQLPERFQQEIDRQAMRLGLTGSDDYLAQWEWRESRERPGTPDEVLDTVAAELEAALDERRRAERGP